MAPYEILAGPLTLFLAPVGTAFPLLTAAPAAGWFKVGTSGDANYDESGVTVSHVEKLESARTAGTTGPRKAWRTEEDLMIGVTMLDVSLEQYALALNGNAVKTVAAAVGQPGAKTIGLSQGQDVTAYALLARGSSAYADGLPAQYEVPRCYQSANPKPVFKKGTPAGIELEFTALEDLAATAISERFGRLRMAHTAAI